MKEKFGSLGIFERAIVGIAFIFIVLFAVLYAKTCSKEGYLYRERILERREENGNILYSGRLAGKKVCFTVSDESITYNYGEKVYGPYTVRKDPTALQKGMESEIYEGIEVRRGEDVVFRGAAAQLGSIWIVYDEKGFSGVQRTVSGRRVDINGNLIDEAEPDIYELLELKAGPKAESKGDWHLYGYGVVACIIGVLSVIFAEELFRLRMIFTVRDPESAEPSEWELFGRYLAGILMMILALMIFTLGLR